MPDTPDQKICASRLAQGSDLAGSEERVPHAALPASLPQETLSAGGGLSAGRPRSRNAVFSGDPLSSPRPSAGRGPGAAGGPGARRDEPAPSRPPAPAEGSGAGERSVRSQTRAFNTNATKNAWINYAEGFLDFFQVIKFRFLAFILVPGSTRRHGRQKSSLIVPGFKFDFVT